MIFGVSVGVFLVLEIWCDRGCISCGIVGLVFGLELMNCLLALGCVLWCDRGLRIGVWFGVWSCGTLEMWVLAVGLDSTAREHGEDIHSDAQVSHDAEREGRADRLVAQPTARESE